MNQPLIVIINGGMSQHSATLLLGQRFADSIEGRAGDLLPRISHITLRGLAHDIVDMQLTGVPSDELEQALNLLENADAVIALSPTYAGSYAGIFKAFIDLVGTSRLAGTPVIVAATGGSARHSLMVDTAMRSLFSSLHALVMPTAVYAASADFADRHLNQRVHRATDELVEALRFNLWRGHSSSGSVDAVSGADSAVRFDQPADTDASVDASTAVAAASTAVPVAVVRPSVDENKGLLLLGDEDKQQNIAPGIKNFVPMGEVLRGR